jgi:hypothetical protein
VKVTTLAAVLITAIVIAAACGGSRQNVETVKQDKRAEIIALWTQIRGWRLDANMDLDPEARTVFQLRKQTVSQAKQICPATHPVPATCNEVCNLADAICDNAERICDIAAELGPDDKLGQEKCESAKASCREAKQRCCQCSEPVKASQAW